MRTQILPLFIFFIVLTACSTISSEPVKDNIIPATVERVVDGDTLKVQVL